MVASHPLATFAKGSRTMKIRGQEVFPLDVRLQRKTYSLIPAPPTKDLAAAEKENK
jgi:hypothetical protein